MPTNSSRTNVSTAHGHTHCIEAAHRANALFRKAGNGAFYKKHVDQLILEYEGTRDDEELPEEFLSVVDKLILTDEYELEPQLQDASSNLFITMFFTTNNNDNANYGPLIIMELANRPTSHRIASLFSKTDSNVDIKPMKQPMRPRTLNRVICTSTRAAIPQKTLRA
ncbi:hypothetical protein TSTA_011950 [Talaromyces stipitatus ATCC 10500]|uniref:Uncharacterized protein n=1 Tax=Talaromyces stipitatus (strain ATCC 10500 / CBS 375.48 / QM 6759 / NRRL 1006) TaxID=441959 RepID=B8ME09_TALSN|nr:uncharacterized protein TSTA_011950 [Talaromyces stipitatus ATCC 10500]EED16086.1 hypothetical protein TSTA_011950 [Talaromyces stipitatus ATCC 10500]